VFDGDAKYNSRLPVSVLERLLLLGALIGVLIVELLNSAIEAVIDRISMEHNELSGRAKDLGSAAVLLSLILTALIWGTVLGRLITT
jgi:diacylglycerol kinase (ATP)